MISIVLGTFFGDEGKGQTVHNLCNKYIGKRESVLVVRFSGGHQVGHTVKHGCIPLVTLAAEPYLECRRTGPNTVL